MRKHRSAGVVLTAAALVTLVASSAGAEPVMTTEHWADNDPAFAQVSKRIQSHFGRNLLARKGVRFVSGQSCPGDVRCLADGNAGTRSDEGRVFLDGQPSVLTYYLGGLKPIHEVGVFSFNCDTRANQDFEVRFADNSREPGKMPQFDRADLATGDKILGQNRGGFHTRFAGRDGPLAAADWVQFRIWRTHGAEAGDRAKGRSGNGASVVIELEVLGEPSDVVLPSKEELARQEAIRNAPKEPEFVKKATWQETLVANREAILEWESLQDRLALPEVGVTLGPWYVLGPIPASSKDLAQLRRETKIDLSQRYPGKDGAQIAWEKCDSMADGRVHDLANYRGAGKDDVVVLCRPAAFEWKLENRQLAVALGADQGSAVWLPERRGCGVNTPVELASGGQEVSAEPGEHQLLVELRADGSGRRRFYFQPQPGTARPGAGNSDARWNRRSQLMAKVRQQFAEPVDQMQIRWESEDFVWLPRNRSLEDWLPGHVEVFLKAKYRQAAARRLGLVEKELAETAGVKSMALAPVKEQLKTRCEKLREKPAVGLAADDLARLRERYFQATAVGELVAAAAQVRSMRLAVEDQRETFKDRYPRAGEFLGRIAVLEKKADAMWRRVLGDGAAPLDALVDLQQEVGLAGSEILLENPVLAFDKLLVVRGNSGFASNWDGPNHLGGEIAVLSPVRPDGKLTTLHKGSVSDMDLHWNAEKLLFSDGRALWEIRTDGTGLRRVSAEDPPVTHYDGCYLPDGKICCVSNACEQAVPCTGGANVGNLHLMDADGRNERRVSFDQDHDWNPTVMNDGRVLYSRWEYTDLPHYFSRILFRMNPDGTSQMEYYGSNSYWPNAMYWPRPIPGHPTMVVCVVSGHHGVSRVGELVLLDPARGRQEAEGAVQRLPGYGKRVEPIIEDNLVGDSWPKFAAPWPLAELPGNRGAGKYFLACVKRDEYAAWDLCLVDVFDNITPILTGGWMTPIPLRPRLQPPVIPSQVDLARKDALIYLADIYQGDGLRGYPRGSIKALRVGSHEFRFAGNGDTRASSYEGGWDVKKILGTVPVEADGSALFRVPANTPIFVQPLDAEGKAQQQMRSWYTAMPGEVASCVGCHERQNSGPPSKRTLAALRRPSDIAAWNGPVRGFSFDREVQPVLDRRCVGCHDGKPHPAGGQTVTTIDLRAKRLHADFTGDYSPAYMALQRYVRRAGYESDNHMHAPAEFEPDTSVLVQMLEKGHYNVRLSPAEWERLYAWIDFNVPYPANWRESHRPPRDDQVERRVKHQKLFAAIDDRDEEPLPLPPISAYEPPPPAPPRSGPVSLAGWPLTSELAQELQKAAGPVKRQVTLPGGATMDFVLVPAGQFVMGDAGGFDEEQPQSIVRIDRPFYLGQFEVTNRQYAVFDTKHDSAYIEGRGKDRTTRGTPINAPDQPVVRISWHEAMAFCRWLSQEAGCRATLPTEAQWEWACRAGTATAFHAGEPGPKLRAFANLADGGLAGWNYGRAEPGYSDGVNFTAPGGRFPPNAWGLCDMHGNVAEWCASSYKPYPYDPRDGRDDPRQPGAKVIRGGSWNDTFRYATSAARWRYQPHQPIYNVGFRVLLESGAKDAVAVKDQ